MAQDDRDAYGHAVLGAILKLQGAALARELPTNKCPCASGTWHTDGDKILAAIHTQNRVRA